MSLKFTLEHVSYWMVTASEVTMAALPLHKPTTVHCTCCGIPTEFRFTSQTDQAVCPPCQKHGQNADKRNNLHRLRWIAHDRARNEFHRKRQAEAAKSLADVRAERDEQAQKVKDMLEAIASGYNSPEAGLVKPFLQNGVVVEAEKKMRNAYFARDMAFKTMTRIQEFHHPVTGTDKCQCGEYTFHCKVLEAIEWEGTHLERWQRKQLQLLNAGKRHDLPDNHPAVLASGRRASGF